MADESNPPVLVDKARDDTSSRQQSDPEQHPKVTDSFRYFCLLVASLVAVCRNNLDWLFVFMVVIFQLLANIT